MDLNKKLEPYFLTIEKVLIMLIFGSVLLGFFIGTAEEIFSVVIVVFQSLLIIFYFIQLQNRLYALLWLAFLLSIIAYFFSDKLFSILYFLFNSVGYVTFGIIVLAKTIKYSLRNKNFELLNFIMGFLLVSQIALPFLPLLSKAEEVLTAYTFALSFSIGTIIYNDNLWHRYNSDEKNIIKYILIVALVFVLQSSFKYLSI